MLKVGITGGIGSGKSIVCQVFETLGIPVFKADDAARWLMENDYIIQEKLKNLLSDEIYLPSGKLNKELLYNRLFNNKQLLQDFNGIIHPATIAYGNNWMNTQTSPYVIKEAALFFESGTNASMDVMIGVYADRDIRTSRVVKRSKLSIAKIEEIMSNQMSDDEKMKLCDYVILNDDKHALLPQILELHSKLLKKVAN